MVGISKQPHKEKNICGAKAKSTGEPCEKPAGWGTDHQGEGKCKYHGGASKGAPKGNKNAVKHGIYEKEIKKKMNEDEKEVYSNISTEEGLEQELKILRFKLLRLLEPVEQQKIIDGGRIATIEIDEVTKSKAIAKLVDNIRKLIKDNKEINGGDEADKVDEVVSAMMKAAEGD